MPLSRRQTLKESLNRELQRQIHVNALDQRAQLAWLFEQLHHYVERWLAMGTRQSEALADDALFQMVEVATEVLTETLLASDVADSVQDAWNRFATILANIRATGRFPAAAEVRAALKAARS